MRFGSDPEFQGFLSKFKKFSGDFTKVHKQPCKFYDSAAAKMDRRNCIKFYI